MRGVRRRALGRPGRPPRGDIDVDRVMGELEQYHPAIGVSPRGYADAQISLPAQSLAQACVTAAAVVSAAYGAAAIACEVMTEKEFDARQGHVPMPELVGVTEAAAMLGVSRQAVLQRIDSGSLPGEKIGRGYAIPLSALQAVLQRALGGVSGHCPKPPPCGPVLPYPRSALALRRGSTMATGTTGGLLDSAKATSVFKHEILRQYIPPFVAKVASTADKNRVMLVDGFAGRGRFDDGTKGSAEYFLAAARDQRQAKTSVRLFEVNKPDADRLAAVVAEYRAVGVDATSECGDIRERLDDVVREAAGIPLFVLLDPCGQNLPYEQLAALLRDQRPDPKPSTEVLLNLSADFTRRIGGTLRAGLTDAKGLLTMDSMMGGNWWRELALDTHAAAPDGSWGAAADAVADAYTRRLATESRMGGAVTPVRRKPENQATYHLAYLTRNNEGLWVMAAAIAKGRQKWLEFNGPQDDDTQLALFASDPVGDLIADEQEACVRRLRDRVLTIAARGAPFRLVDHTIEVLGDDYGTVTESTVSVVMKEIVKEGRLARRPGDKLHQATFTPTGLVKP
jgi:three-Cys-motif partner protein